MSSRATVGTTAMTDAIEAGARAIEAYIGQIFGADAPHTFAQAAIEAAIASGALVPASAVAEMRERCAKWHDEQSAEHAKFRAELNRYSDDHEERTAWRDRKDKEDFHGYCAAHIRQLDLAPASGGYVVGDPNIKPVKFMVGNESERDQIFIEYRGRDLWAVTDGASSCLATDGEWEIERLPSNRTDEFFSRCRFSFEEAVRRALHATTRTGSGK